MHPLAVLLRVVVAVGGGFGVTSLAVLVMAGLLARAGWPGSDAVVAAGMAGFVLYLGLLLWGLASVRLAHLCGGLSLWALGLFCLLRWVV